jgi:hypothetical protein
VLPVELLSEFVGSPASVPVAENPERVRVTDGHQVRPLRLIASSSCDPTLLWRLEGLARVESSDRGRR